MVPASDSVDDRIADQICEVVVDEIELLGLLGPEPPDVVVFLRGAILDVALPVLDDPHVKREIGSRRQLTPGLLAHELNRHSELLVKLTAQRTSR